jgi:hypothetical protein
MSELEEILPMRTSYDAYLSGLRRCKHGSRWDGEVGYYKQEASPAICQVGHTIKLPLGDVKEPRSHDAHLCSQMMTDRAPISGRAEQDLDWMTA